MDWQPPPHWIRIATVDAHAAGEPLRIVTAGFPRLEGRGILERRRDARNHHDSLRRALMWEPRGHRDMYGAVVTEPATADGDLGVLFLHNEGYSTMCGHGIVALATVAVETGMVEPQAPETRIRFDTPAGRVVAIAHVEAGRVRRVSFSNVPSFVLARDVRVDVEGVGRVTCDIAYGGAFYAYVDAGSVGAVLEPSHVRELVDLGMRIKAAVQASHPVAHPAGAPDLAFLYGTIFVQPVGRSGVHSRNVCIFADGEVDRSPTGTGVSGRAAIHHARAELAVGQTLTVESLIGTRFDVKILETTRVGPLEAVVPEVSGTAHITGRHEFYVDPEDPLREGFLLG